MIHELVVTPDESPQKLRKRARKLAMTGGYEVVLSPELKQEQLLELLSLYESELSRYEKNTAAYSASLSGRILQQLATHPDIGEEEKKRVQKLF